MKSYLLIISAFFILFACKKVDTSAHQIARAGLEFIPLEDNAKNETRNKYWYQGKAEISRYTLSQNRYGDNHPGEVILIFVTEDFLTDKQVKNDRYKEKNSTAVLKNNIIRQFSTGIYDYSMMSSVFTPIQSDLFPQTFKVTSSSQDWCGQTYQQINSKNGKFEVQLRSYFESEADQNFQLNVALLEDELYNRIRLDPKSLPVGEIKIIPSSQICRLMHLKFEIYSAKASRSEYKGEEFEGSKLMEYQVNFPSLKRNLQIIYEEDFPHKIAGYKDSYPSMFDKKIRTTIAKKTHERYAAYWQENSLGDNSLRSTLGR